MYTLKLIDEVFIKQVNFPRSIKAQNGVLFLKILE